MAKGKHSAALFEVIKAGSKRTESVEGPPRTSRWWFKGRQFPVHKELPESSFTDPEPVEISSAPAPRPNVSAPSTSRLTDGRSSGVQVDFDKGRKEVTIRVRYTTAIVSAFAVCALIGLAYVLGGHLGHGPQAAQAVVTPQTIAELMKQPPQAGVTVLNRPKPSVLRPQPISNPQAAANGGIANVVAPKPSVSMSLVPAGAETRLPRTIGLNYAIVQTYPPEEMPAAEAARDFLTANGIPCTLETTDFVRKTSWVCLVGTAGFTKISSSDYRSYVDNIVRLGEKFPSSHFDRFKPAAYKWKG
jgi:hypothetical protein